MNGLVLVFRDISEQRRIEKERQRANQIESLGVLASGIAHDFNNARQAMQDHGNINITCWNTIIKEGEKGLLAAGHYVTVEIQDEGNGIDPEKLGKIFEPYYTTKKTGNGIGLAVVYSMIQQHGGQIMVSSTPGQCTTFRFYLPASMVSEEEIPNVSGR